ncbi:hypothetical protein MTR67_000628 [Solanum verrucosum]|uniref:Uncharacterized protein n=1 Tax=Solanum verrucosum TaxID=315347 RepID=A0AAF0PLR4_SOLVR|nr:hypothetical protein MTR67_000628 [Solanum verrucosum]
MWLVIFILRNDSIQDYMFQESVCRLLRASWFKPLIVEEKQEVDDDMDYLYVYYKDDKKLEDFRFTSSPSLLHRQ